LPNKYLALCRWLAQSRTSAKICTKHLNERTANTLPSVRLALALFLAPNQQIHSAFGW